MMWEEAVQAYLKQSIIIFRLFNNIISISILQSRMIFEDDHK